VGIVLENNKSTKEVTVGEAFIKVRAVSLSEYLSKTEKRKKVKVMRPKKTSNRFHILKKYFISQLEGLPYDREFRLNNSINGIEAIYCSELVYKLLTWTGNTTPDLSIMLFDVNRDYWEKYFRGNVPDGEYGISPSDFDDENLYEFVGYL